MIAPRDRAAILDQEYLVTRGRILEVAAALDRLDRAPEHPADHHHPDQRLGLLRQAIEVLSQPGPDRAETIQRLLSIAYEPDWIATKAPAQRRN